MQFNKFYNLYLFEFYAKTPGLADRPYQEQITAILSDGFAAAHMRTPYMMARGYECLHVIGNCIPLQTRWAAEHGLPLPQSESDLEHLVLKQVESFKPDVLFLGDTLSWPTRMLMQLRPRPPLVIGWNAAVIPEHIEWHGIDLMLSSDEGCLKLALERGATASRFFRPHFPAFIAEAVSGVPKKWDTVFTGQITGDHRDRMQMLINVAKAPLSGRGEFTPAFFLAQPRPELMPAGLCMHNHGAVWGLAMHEVLKSGKIILNVHIDMAAKKSLNMRTFEATGTGSFFLTEYSDVLPDYFEIGTEVETYRDSDEMIDKIYFYLYHEEAREKIAKNGQSRCLKYYSAAKGAEELDSIIHEYL
jgi:hypothetical protein